MKPVLVGMNNPLGTDPRHALFPAPVGCTGYRLWEMLNERSGAFRQDYVEGFDRVNLLNSIEFDHSLARRSAQELAPRLAGRSVVLLGNEVLRAFGLPPDTPLLSWQTGGGGGWVRWVRAPHPSGRNLWFNDAAHRFAMGCLLEELLASNGAA